MNINNIKGICADAALDTVEAGIYHMTRVVRSQIIHKGKHIGRDVLFERAYWPMERCLESRLRYLKANFFGDRIPCLTSCCHGFTTHQNGSHTFGQYRVPRNYSIATAKMRRAQQRPFTSILRNIVAVLPIPKELAPQSAPAPPSTKVGRLGSSRQTRMRSKYCAVARHMARRNTHVLYEFSAYSENRT